MLGTGVKMYIRSNLDDFCQSLIILLCRIVDGDIMPSKTALELEQIRLELEEFVNQPLAAQMTDFQILTLMMLQVQACNLQAVSYMQLGRFLAASECISSARKIESLTHQQPKNKHIVTFV